MNFFKNKNEKIKGWIKKKRSFDVHIYLFFFEEISKLHILSKILTLVKPGELNNMRNEIGNQVKVFVGIEKQVKIKRTKFCSIWKKIEN